MSASAAIDVDIRPRSAIQIRMAALGRAYFGSPLNALITLSCAALLIWIGSPLLRWGVLEATWSGGPDDCRAGAGACWAFIVEKSGMSVFGLYPYEERWRPTLMLALFVGMVLLSAQQRFWSKWLVYGWIAIAPVLFGLMKGGFFGLVEVPTRLWGGLTVTVFVSVFGLATGYPGAILLALGRRSSLPLIRWLSIATIETVRGVPLISLIFMAAIMAPLFMPSGVEIDRLFRVQLAYTIFSSAYLAEVVRGGLQGVNRGQDEAARSLGLHYWARMRLIILPQALKSTIPVQVNTFIVLFKDTTLVVIVGVFDFFTTLRAAMGDSHWLGFSVEAYVYAALVYLVLCSAMSRYSQRLEIILNPERRSVSG